METLETHVGNLLGGTLTADPTDPTEIQMPCNQKCGRQVTVKKWAASIIPFVTCKICYDRKIQEESASDQSSSTEDDVDWRELCPFDDTDLNRLHITCVKNLMEWGLKDGSLFISGKSGSGKTRATWSRLLQFWRSGKSFYYFEGNDFSRRSTETSTKPEHFMRDLIGAHLVVLDDLKFTNASRTAMANLADMIKKRGEWKRPTLIVSQENTEGWLGMVKERDEIVFEAIKRRIRKYPVQRFVYKGEDL